LNQLAFRFDPLPAPPVDDLPRWFETKLDKKGTSYLKIGIMRNADGTWSRSTRDNLQGWCGHGGPFYGDRPTFAAALEWAIRDLRKSYQWKSEDRHDSVQTDRHRAMGRAGLEWLDELAAEHGIQLRTDA
jgi:hypothetical protein